MLGWKTLTNTGIAPSGKQDRQNAAAFSCHPKNASYDWRTEDPTIPETRINASWTVYHLECFQASQANAVANQHNDCHPNER